MNTMTRLRTERNGRRIYIHEASFVALSQQSADAAEIIFNSLARATAVKIVHHHIAQAVEFGLTDPAKARRVTRRLDARHGHALTESFRRIGYQSSQGGHHDFFPLLSSDERIVASCTEAGYFTFATGTQSAKRMYAEKGNMHLERVAIREGRGPSDLTWINGRKLALLDPSLPVGINTASYYFGPGARRQYLSQKHLDGIKLCAASETLASIEAVVRGRDAWTGDGEAMVLGQLIATLKSALAGGIFAVSRDSVSPPGETPTNMTSCEPRGVKVTLGMTMMPSCES